MTIKEIIKSFAITLAKGARLHMINVDDFDNIIAKAYQEGFEDGMVFMHLGKLPNATYTLETDEELYRKYAETEQDITVK